MKKLLFVAALMASGTVFTFAQQSPAATHPKQSAPAIHQQNTAVKPTNAETKTGEKAEMKKVARKETMHATQKPEAKPKREIKPSHTPAPTK